MKDFRALGRHIILELYNCPPDLLMHPVQSEQFLLEAARLMNATVVTSQFHAFSPYGVSGVVIIQESHLTIHTWPEHRYAAVDIFTCGELDLQAGVAYLQKVFQADRSDVKELKRGLEIKMVQEQS